ncbi:ABC transporter permease protein YxdM [Paenibacillus sp. J23TS9]|uniref:FtsX-like permease family protein n=1 Tax=Paenibacillus sp. J23TS9 TaxID=2807193 RepID=UPI001B0D8D5A|nr:ABC transporter permease [Paenibacillus sp. J23TS9]GIP30138.1 ABC transporter permease protein YxdM [Paenibacillus sp. J23TS9]
MSFPQFAFNNVRRNLRAYISYFLSSAVMVMIFFAYSVFIYHPDISHSEFGKYIATSMRIASYVIYLFSFFFVLYSISAFLKARNQEFGILTILGAQTRQINWLIFLENMLIGVSAIVTGVAGGLLISKLFLMVSTKIIGEVELSFYWPVKALIVTSSAFMVLFVIVSLFTLLFIRKKKVLELLKGSTMPKKEPQVSWLLSILGAALLVTGFVSVCGEYSKNTLMIAALTGIAGTYFFYTQLSVIIVRLLKKNRPFMWRSTNLIRISEMSYKLKDNARMLFMVTVVTAIACMVSSVLLFMSQSNRELYNHSPYSLVYTVYDSNNDKPDLMPITAEIKAHGADYTELKIELLHHLFTLNGDTKGIDLLPVSKFRLLSEQTGLPGIEDVSEADAILILCQTTNVQNYKDFANASLQAKSNLKLTVKQTVNTDTLPFGQFSSPFLVVNDTVYKKLQQDPDISKVTRYLYKVPAWDGSPPSLSDPEVIAGTKLFEWNQKKSKEHHWNYGLFSRGENYQSSKQATSMMSFVGVFIALIFSVSSASFLYFKLHTELNKDQRMYQAMSKIGLSPEEMSRAATTQIALLFYIPVFVAIIETLAVVVPILHGLNQTHIMSPILMTAAAFTAVQTVYFLIIRSRYVRSLRKIMV